MDFKGTVLRHSIKEAMMEEQGKEPKKPKKRKRWTVESAKACIQRNGGHVSGGLLVGQIRCNRPGLKVLSAIDFLVNHHKYIWMK